MWCSEWNIFPENCVELPRCTAGGFCGVQLTPYQLVAVFAGVVTVLTCFKFLLLVVRFLNFDGFLCGVSLDSFVLESWHDTIREVLSVNLEGPLKIEVP